MVHFDAMCIGCSIYCLQIFRPEIPVHVTKLCQMNRFQNLENKLCWVLSFFCFPLEAQELVDLPNAYLTLACHSKLFFLSVKWENRYFTGYTSSPPLFTPRQLHSLSFHACFLATAFLFLHLLHFQSTVSLNSITLVLKVGKKFWLEQVNVHCNRRPRQKCIWLVPECQWNEHRSKVTYSMGSTFC